MTKREHVIRTLRLYNGALRKALATVLEGRDPSTGDVKDLEATTFGISTMMMGEGAGGTVATPEEVAAVFDEADGH